MTENRIKLASQMEPCHLAQEHDTKSCPACQYKAGHEAGVKEGITTGGVLTLVFLFMALGLAAIVHVVLNYLSRG